MIFFIIDTIIHAIVDLEGEISESDGYLKAMEVCVHSIRMDTENVTPAEKVFFLSSFQRHSDELQHVKSLFNNIKNQYQTSLNVSNTSKSGSSSSSSQSLHESTRMLEESRRVLHQSQAVSDEVIIDLEHQKESLLSSQNHVKQTTQVTNDAKAILKQMRTTIWLKKIRIYVIIVVLAVTIALIVYFGIIRKHVKRKR